MNNESEFSSPAFPTESPFGFEDGMSLRDYFAAKAMQGMLSGLLADSLSIEFARIAQDAYKQADAMMKAKNL